MTPPDVRAAELSEEPEAADRLAALERKLDGIAARLGIDVSDEPGAPATERAARILDAPARTLDHPVRWRTLTDTQRRDRWLDLAAWVDWLVDAYRLPPRVWGKWWECPGAFEELATLRAWHREVADVAIAARPRLGKDADLAALIEWQRAERIVRLDWARSSVEWHDALWRFAARVAGATPEQKPLLLREGEATPLTATLREESATARAEEFTKWLDKRLPPPPPPPAEEQGVDADAPPPPQAAAPRT